MSTIKYLQNKKTLTAWASFIRFLPSIRRSKNGETKKANKVEFVLETLYKKGGVFKYPKVFQCDNGSEFKSDEPNMLEKHNYIRRTTTKYKQTHYALPEDGLCRYLYQPGEQHGNKKNTLSGAKINSD